MKFYTIRDLHIDMKFYTQTEDGRVILKSISEAHQFSDGKMTETVEGHRYNVEIPGDRKLCLSVKIKDGETPLISPEALKERGEMLVSFEGVETKFYTNKKGYPDFSVSATNIKREDV